MRLKNVGTLWLVLVAAVGVIVPSLLWADLSVSDVVCHGAGDDSGLIEIDCNIGGVEDGAPISVVCTAVDNMDGRVLPMYTYWQKDNPGHIGSFFALAGRVSIVWNAAVDVGSLFSSNVSIRVQAVQGVPKYMVVDIAKGTAASSFPVSYLTELPREGWTEEYKTEKIVMRAVPAGSFAMGSFLDEVGRADSDAAQHKVTISKPFYIGVFPVTQRQYELIMGENPSYFTNLSFSATRPVEYLAYEDVRGSTSWPANDFVGASSLMGKLRAKTSLKFDMPTEAQWEYACRAGTTTALNSGRNLERDDSDEAMNEVGRYRFNCQTISSPLADSNHALGTNYGTMVVGAYRPNELGIYDMHGNVYEFCLDYDQIGSAFGEDPVVDPKGPTSGSSRVLRGGSFGQPAGNCRSASRSATLGGYGVVRSNTYGVRLCAVPPAEFGMAEEKTATGVCEGFCLNLLRNQQGLCCRQRYPWNGLVDIDLDLSFLTESQTATLKFETKDLLTGRTIPMNTFESGAFTGLGKGHHHFVWNADVDAPGIRYENLVTSVSVTYRNPDDPPEHDWSVVSNHLYMVVDLSGGPSVESYPVSYMTEIPQGGWRDEYKTSKLVLRAVPADSYVMGCSTKETGSGTGYDSIPHKVTFKQAFYVGVFEITQRQYELVTGQRPSYFAREDCYQTRPVDALSWNMIRGDSSIYDWPTTKDVDPTSFIGLIRAKTGLTGFDLPTDAQWEYVCRAGTTTALNDGHDLSSTSTDANLAKLGRYKYNTDTDSISTYRAPDTTTSTDRGTAAVGSYAPNAWGFYDMHGNVGEWCLDWYVNRNGLSSDDVVDPDGPVTGSDRVYRGGTWTDWACYCRSASRVGIYPSFDYQSRALGFRLASSLPVSYPGETPDIPVGLSAATSLSELAVVLRWSPVEYAMSYQVFRSESARRENAVLVATVDSATYVDYAVAAQTRYYYWVRGVSEVGVVGGFSEGADAIAEGRVAKTYMVIDVSGGADAGNYPVSYLDDKPQSGWTDEYKKTKIVLRRLPAGSFVMGCPSDEVGYMRYLADAPYSFDAIPHAVSLSHDCYVGVFEITQRQWELVMGNRPSWFSQESAYAMRPVENVSYRMIRGRTDLSGGRSARQSGPDSFLGRLGRKAGLDISLPTEAQWEYACRAGKTTSLNSGSNLSDVVYDSAAAQVARYRGNSGYSGRMSRDWTASKGTAIVGSYAPNAWGLYDLHGNVREWCLDGFSRLTGTDPVTDPLGLPTGEWEGFVIRGGSWFDFAHALRSGYRHDFDAADGRSVFCGFRIACEVE